MKTSKGFTMVELLFVIAIIAVLSVIILTTLASTKERGNRSSAVSTATSIMAELATCTAGGGYGYTDGAPSAGITYLCQNAATGNSAASGTATTFWPSLGSTGWAYQTPTGTLAANTYAFNVTKAGQTTITCTVSTTNCH